MKQIFSSALVILMLALGVNAQTPVDTAKDAGELTRMLNEFLAGASRNDPGAHDRFWAEDVIYTGSAGKRRGKADIMHDVRSAPAPKPGDPSTVYSAADIRIQQYGDTAIVAFRLVATTQKNSATETTNYLNSGTILKRDGKWQVVNWQSTRMPREEERANGTTDAGEPSVTLPPELARVLTDYERDWRTGDGTALAHLFAEDGFVLTEGRAPVKGRAAIQKLYSGNGTPLSLRAFTYATNGDLGYIIGGFSRERGKPDEGKFTLTLRKTGDGQWLIISDMDNSNHR